MKTVESILRAQNAYGATFYDIGEHSPIAGIRAGVAAFRDNGCDIIVSVGGGSPIDASKAILYYIQQERGGPMPLQIAVPTTLSAAEYTVGAGFTETPFPSLETLYLQNRSLKVMKIVPYSIMPGVHQPTLAPGVLTRGGP